MQDESGGVLIDDGSAFLAADIGRDQFTFYRGGRETFIPECDRQLCELGEITGECARRLCSRPFAAIHIDRQAKYKSDCRTFSRECDYAPRVRGERLARDSLDGGCKLSIGVTGGDPDRLGSKVEPNQSPADGQM